MSEGLGIPVSPPDQPAPLIPSPPHPPPVHPPGEQEPPGGVGVPAPPLVPPPPDVTVPEALPEMGKLAMLIVLLGLIALASALIQALNNLFRWMLGPLWPRSRKTPATAEQFTQWLSNPLGDAFQSIDADIGLSFTKLGQMASRVGQSLVAGELAAYQIAQKIRRVQQHSGAQDAQTAQTRVQVKQAQAAATHAAQAAQTATITAGEANASLAQRVDGLSTHITQVIEPELDALRHRIPELEHGATSAWDLLKQHDEALGIAGLTAGAAIGMARLGADWTRCENNQNLGKKLCGLDASLLKKLLGGALDVLAISELCALTKAISAFVTTGFISGALSTIIGGMDDLIQCQGVARPTPLDIPAPDVAPPTAWATLTPANV